MVEISTFRLLSTASVITLAILLPIPIRALHKKLRIANGLSSIPGPKGTLFLGLVPELIKHKKRYYHYIQDLLTQYGNIVKTPWSIFDDGAILTKDPTIVQHMLATNYSNYIRSPRQSRAFKELFDYAFLGIHHAHTPDDGAMWRLQRKIAAKIFTKANFKLYAEEVFAKYSKSTLQILEMAAEKKESVNFQELSSLYTLSSIFDIAFGEPLQSVMDPQEFLSDLDWALQHIVSRMQDKKYYVFLSWLMPSEYKFHACVKRIYAVADRILQPRLLLPNEEVAKRSDLLSLFVHKAHELEETKADVLLDYKTLRSLVVQFILGGRDTTAASLTYTMYAIAQYPDIQQNIRNELHNIVDADTKKLTYDHIKKMQYLDAVVHETLRLYPVVAINARMAVEDDILPNAEKTFVPAGTKIAVVILAMGRNKEQWGEDAMEFRPERWLEMKTRPTAYEYPVFHAGPRSCLGMNMALVEAKMLLASILMKYEVDFSNEKHYVRANGREIIDQPYTTSITVHMKEGLHVKFTPLLK